MEISPILQARLLLYCTLTGVASGCLYTALKIVGFLFGGDYKLHSKRMPKKSIFSKKEEVKNSDCNASFFAQKTVIRFIVDFATLTVSGVCVILLNYSYNSGRFRFFGVLGWFLGFAFYYFLLKKAVEPALEKIIFLFRWLFCSIFVTFSYPFRKILVFFVEKIKKLLFLCSFTIANIKKKVYNNKKKGTSENIASQTNEKRHKIRLSKPHEDSEKKKEG